MRRRVSNYRACMERSGFTKTPESSKMLQQDCVLWKMWEIFNIIKIAITFQLLHRSSTALACFSFSAFEYLGLMSSGSIFPNAQTN
ncbi:hypothetical protein VULLAG_LOCUS12242 [Vulpes lagopus]